jgi:hypothetical protein
MPKLALPREIPTGQMIVCLGSNTMGYSGGDLEKSEADGTSDGARPKETQGNRLI